MFSMVKQLMNKQTRQGRRDQTLRSCVPAFVVHGERTDEGILEDNIFVQDKKRQNETRPLTQDQALCSDLCLALSVQELVNVFLKTIQN